MEGDRKCGMDAMNVAEKSIKITTVHPQLEEVNVEKWGQG